MSVAVQCPECLVLLPAGAVHVCRRADVAKERDSELSRLRRENEELREDLAMSDLAREYLNDQVIRLWAVRDELRAKLAETETEAWLNERVKAKIERGPRFCGAHADDVMACTICGFKRHTGPDCGVAQSVELAKVAPVDDGRARCKPVAGSIPAATAKHNATCGAHQGRSCTCYRALDEAMHGIAEAFAENNMSEKAEQIVSAGESSPLLDPGPAQNLVLPHGLHESGPGLRAKGGEYTEPGKRDEPITVDLSGDYE